LESLSYRLKKERKKERKEGRKRFDLPLLEMQRRRRSQQHKILQLPSLKNPSAR